MEGLIFTSCYFRVIATGLMFLINITTSFASCADTTIGVENKYIIPNSSFTASSHYNHRYSPYHARLNGNLYGWAARRNTDPNDYLQIDFGLPYVICAVATQGSGVGSEWVTQYKISLSVNNINWTLYQENGALKLFAGNTDSRTIKKHNLTQPLARYIRFIPITYHIWKTMRVGIYGYLKDVVPTKYSNSTIWALEGNDVTLSCYTTGDEPIKYTWSKSGSLLLDSSVAKTRGDDLVVRLQSDRDFGTYICNASNSEEMIVYRINRVQLKKYITRNPDICKRSESKAMEVVPYVIPYALIILVLIICIVYLVYRLRKEKQLNESIIKKTKSRSDERGITNDVMDNSDHPVDVIKNSRKPETAEADEIETPGCMELKPRQSSDTIFLSIEEPANRPGKSETQHAQGTTGHEQYMDLKPRVNTEYETLHHEKNAEPDYENVGQGFKVSGYD